MYPGQFITFEGIDGSGKTTQAAMLTEALIKSGINAIQTKEPSDSIVGKAVRELVCNETMLSETELLLITADRKEHFHNIIKPALQNGVWVVCDRFIHSSMVYQNPYRAMQLHAAFIENYYPDITFVLDLDIESAINRIESRQEIKNKFDAAPLEQMIKRKNAFRRLGIVPNVLIIDADGSPQRVHERICNRVHEIPTFGRNILVNNE